jgi:hypothetical protein
VGTSEDAAAVPPPEWARKLANTCTGMTYDFIARLLATLRESTLREAADKALWVAERADREHQAAASKYLEGERSGASQSYHNILALIEQPPKEAK